MRFQALRRDGWKCVECGARGRLEVDHVKPVRDRPDLAFALDNLQSLCVACHSRKTRLECGLRRDDPARMAWKNILRGMRTEPRKELIKCWKV
nr:HNH endonuclease signature motif containing protein [Chelativorans petroleitrophicus]